MFLFCPLACHIAPSHWNCVKYLMHAIRQKVMQYLCHVVIRSMETYRMWLSLGLEIAAAGSRGSTPKKTLCRSSWVQYDWTRGLSVPELRAMEAKIPGTSFHFSPSRVNRFTSNKHFSNILVLAVSGMCKVRSRLPILAAFNTSLLSFHRCLNI